MAATSTSAPARDSSSYNNGVQRNIELQTTVTTGIDNHSAASSSSLLYDLQGRRLNGKPEKGLYIQNGRKQVVR